jgi:glycosyltransferase involved in cell wall biosynthesis
LRAEGFTPEVIYAHPGWGEALFLRDVFPAARLVLYCEFYYRARGADVGFDPEYPGAPDDAYRLRIKNAAALLSLEASDAGTSPTNWQRDSFPGEFKARIRVVHDGIDTDFFAPGGADALDLPHGGARLTRGDEVVTYVARNLEPYRGFHSFMRAVPIIQAQRPHAHIVVAGHNGVSYGTALPDGETYKSRLLSEVGACVDMTRLHFIDWLPYGALRTLYRISAAHVYLTYPFVLSWSLLEAMSTGCPIVASDTEPVREIVRDGQNGRLVDFFDPQAIADAVERSIADRSDATPMRLNARATIVERYDLRRVCLPAQMAEFKL